MRKGRGGRDVGDSDGGRSGGLNGVDGGHGCSSSGFGVGSGGDNSGGSGGVSDVPVCGFRGVGCTGSDRGNICGGSSGGDGGGVRRVNVSISHSCYKKKGLGGGRRGVQKFDDGKALRDRVSK